MYFAWFSSKSEKARYRSLLFRTFLSHDSYGPARRSEITKHPQDCMNTVPELFEATFPSKSTCASTLSSPFPIFPALSSKSHLSLKRTLRTHTRRLTRDNGSTSRWFWEKNHIKLFCVQNSQYINFRNVNIIIRPARSLTFN